MFDALRFECNFLAALDERVFLEDVVVAVGKIGSVMAAARFFAGQSRAGDEGGESVKIYNFVIGARRVLASGGGRDSG